MPDHIDIPIIDIASPSPSTAKSLVDAASKYGFVFIRNSHESGNGIPPKDLAGMFDLSKDFFQSPEEVKEQCSIHSAKSGKNRGWLSMHTETLDPNHQKRGDFKEAFNFGEFTPSGHAQQPLCGPLAPAEPRIARFYDSCHALCNWILQVFARGLEVSQEAGGEEWFSSRHDRTKGPSGSILRFLYYPSIPHPTTPPDADKTDIRAGAHSDYGSITLLFQLPGQPGLEILTPSGTWAPVPVNPANDPTPPILVNIGDLLSYWTNGLLKSTVHRVIFPAGEMSDRYSIAYFCHPLDEAELVAVPSKQVGEFEGALEEGLLERLGGGKVEEGKRSLTAKEHLERRLRATYGVKQQGG
ncbi:oxidoreductase [Aulographum hederae CBS 113979]|uniref:Oxidoreductase n=1 Tax=Aulographum hederae CBS 113979 TaxID=1176131 RepID=A0A6G1HAG3_9PEZI|nr:oxidoreductase [Aulographum hederae CBS 113979]